MFWPFFAYSKVITDDNVSFWISFLRFFRVLSHKFIIALFRYHKSTVFSYFFSHRRYAFFAKKTSHLFLLILKFWLIKYFSWYGRNQSPLNYRHEMSQTLVSSPATFCFGSLMLIPYGFLSVNESVCYCSSLLRFNWLRRI